MTDFIKYLCILALIIPSALTSYAQDISGRNDQRDSILRQIEIINRQLSANKKQQKNNLNTLALTKRKIENRTILIARIDSSIAGYNDSINRKNSQIRKLNKRLETLTTYYQALIINAYKNRNTRIWFMYLLSSDNISQGIRRWYYLKNISSAVKIQADEIKSTKASLENERRALKKLVRRSDDEQQLRKKEYDELTEELNSLNSSLSALTRQEKSIRTQLEAKKREMDRINREIAAVIANAVKKEKPAEEITSEDFSDLTGKFSGSRGQLRQPVNNGIIVEPYGQSDHPVFKNVKLPFNNGINISADPDSPAISVFNGIVKQILIIPGYSQCVLVQHGRYYTFYCKLKKASVKAGQQVTAGEEIGIIETASDGHTILHFELWDGTARQNPQEWLRY